MLGYEKDDLKDMIVSVECTLSTMKTEDDPALYNHLVMTQDFLSGLLAEGYFDL